MVPRSGLLRGSGHIGGADRRGVSSAKQGQYLGGHYSRLPRVNSGLPGNRERSLIPLRRNPFSRISVFLTTTVFCRGGFRGRRPNLRRLANEGPQSPVGQKGMKSGLKCRRKGIVHPLLPWSYSVRVVLTFVLSSGRRDLAGLHPERSPIAPPPARLQSLVQRRRRTQGAHWTLLQRRMWTGCLPPTLRWRVP